jgi:hypothetical protein
MAKKTKKTEQRVSHGEIAWDSAEVHKGVLVVEISGDVSKAWSERLAKVLDRLDAPGGWGAVKVGRAKVTVRDVAQGGEGDLRHVLEGAVQQTNADLAPRAEEKSGADEASAADAEMTAAFRSFGAAPDDAEEATQE